MKPLNGHTPTDGAILLSRDITADCRGSNGRWMCGPCGYARNEYSTMRRRISVTCDRCNVEHVLVVENE